MGKLAKALTAAAGNAGGIASGEYVYTNTGSNTFTCPDGVESICVVAIGGGGAGGGGYASGGSGGCLGYKNNISVTPGSNYLVYVGAGGVGVTDTGDIWTPSNGAAGGSSYFVNASTVSGIGGGGGGAASPTVGGNYIGDGGGNGGVSHKQGGGYHWPGGGAGGYSGNGGSAGSSGSSYPTYYSGTPYKGNDGAGGGGGGGGTRCLSCTLDSGGFVIISTMICSFCSVLRSAPPEMR